MIETGAQIKAARALLNWRVVDLADAAGLHRNAVGYWEGQTVITARHRSGWQSGPQRILDAFRRAGVAFINDPGPGVHLVSQAQIPPSIRARGITTRLQQGLTPAAASSPAGKCRQNASIC